MIALTAHVSGVDIAREMSGDMEEAAQFFLNFASRISDDDASDLVYMIKEEMFGSGGNANLRRLGGLLIEASK